jgi:probable rRNA maturation factor
LSRAVKKILAAEGRADGQVGIALVGDPQIRELNRLYRRKDRPTDVLAFAMGEGEGSHINPSLLGDVVISVETATRQSADRGHPLDKEIAILAIHGLYHLLGYDHEKDGGEMAAKEKKALELVMADDVKSS